MVWLRVGIRADGRQVLALRTWFCFLLCLVCIYLKLNIKRTVSLPQVISMFSHAECPANSILK